MTRRDALKDATAALAVAVLVTVFFTDILLFGFNLYLRDFSRTSYPERRVLSSILRAGEFPFWNPLVTGGQPLAANPSYEAFYPPQWLLMFGSFRDTFHLLLVLHFPLAALGLFLLARSLGARRSAAAFAAFSYALSGAMLSMAAVIPFLYALAWLPWVGFFFRRAAHHTTLRTLAPAALTLGMILLAGEVSMILQSGALVGAYAIYLARKERSWRPFLLAIATVLLASLVGVVQIVPSLAHQKDSGRSQPLPRDVTMTWSMPLYRPVEMIWPTAFSAASAEVIFRWALARIYPRERWPWVLNLYPGLLVAILAITGFVKRIRGALFVGAVALVGYLLAIGRFGFLFPALYAAGFRSLRYPEKFILSTLFVVAIFAAIVAEEAIRLSSVRKTAAIVAFVITAISAVIAGFAVLPSFPQWFARFWLLPHADLELATRFRNGILLTFALAASLAVLLAAERLRPSLRMILLALVVIVDHGVRVQGWAPRITADFYEAPAAAKTLASRGFVRIYNPGALQFGEKRALPEGIFPWMARNGLFPSWEWTFGFDGAIDHDVTRMNLRPSIAFEDLVHAVETRNRVDRIPLLLQMAGASHIGVDKPLDPAVVADPRRFDEVEPVRFVPLANAGPYYFAEKILPAAEITPTILATTPIPLRVAFADVPPMTPAVGRVRRVHRTANTLSLDVEADGRAFLVLTVTPHKYWRATIDGQDATLHVTNVGFQGLLVERGTHRVELRYRNPIVVACGWISAAASLLLLIGAAADLFSMKLARPDAAVVRV